MGLPVACIAISAAVAGCSAAEPPVGRVLTARVVEQGTLRAAPDGRPVADVGPWTEWGERRVYRVVERRGNWLGVLTPDRPNGRPGWLKASRAVLRTSAWSIRIDRSARRMTLRHRGRVARRVTVSLGMPSAPTPLGRFAITDKLWVRGSSVYGCCVLALSGKQTSGALAGGRLAIHGTRVPEVLGRYVSNGCARTSERDLRWMMRSVPLGTPVRVVA